jgi:hypothetical protein
MEYGGKVNRASILRTPYPVLRTLLCTPYSVQADEWVLEHGDPSPEDVSTVEAPADLPDSTYSTPRKKQKNRETRE